MYLLVQEWRQSCERLLKVAFLAPIAGILGAVGAGVSAVGSIEGGIAQGQSANYQAQVARNNAIIAEQNSVHAEQAGEEQAQEQSLKSAAMGGRIKAGQAANGVDVNSGSAVDVQTSDREEGKLDTENVFNNAQLQAYGYRTQATNYEATAGLDQTAADEAPIEGVLGATGGLLSNASSLGFKWGKA